MADFCVSRGEAVAVGVPEGAFIAICSHALLSVCLPLPNPEPGVVSGHHPVCLSFRRSVEDIALHAE